MTEQNTKRESQRQRPALMIGLGGTGKQVLLNLRRMFFERYGVASPSHVGHLWIDTDTRNVTLDGKELDFLQRQVDFTEREKIDVELKKSDLRIYYSQPASHPHIFSWFNPELTKHQEISDGAGAIRSFGRLAFFHHYDRIKQRLIDLRGQLSRVGAHTQTRNQFNIEVDPSQLDVWLIFSVAGGTGSGMFLDMAFAIKHLWPNVSVKSIIVLPTVFSSNYDSRIFANAYAALMELEHYSFDKEDIKFGGIQKNSDRLHQFPVAWTKLQYQEQHVAIAGPIFEATYLIDNHPAGSGGSLSLQDKNSLTNMLAEWLFIDYSSGPEVEPLASQKRSAHVNASANRLTPIRYKYHQGFTEVFACRYSSMGLSKIYIPVQRTQIAVQHRLAADIVQFWTADRPIPATLDEMIQREYLHRAEIDNSRQNSDFLRALEMSEDGERITNRLRKIVIDGRKKFRGMAGVNDIRNRINQWVDNDLLLEQLDTSNVIKERWGTLSKLLDYNADKHYETVSNRLEELIAFLLTQPSYRFTVTRETLRRMRDQLLKDQDHFISARDRNRTRSNQLLKETQLRLEWLDDVSGSFTRKTIIDVVLEQIEQRVDSELKAQIANSAADLARRIAEYIGHGQMETNARGENILIESGLLKQLADLQTQLYKDVMPAIRARFEAFSRFDNSPINQDMSLGREEIDEFYIDPKNKSITQDTLTEWEKDLFEEQDSSGPKNVWDVRHNLIQEGTPRFIGRLIHFARDKMWYLQEHSVNVLDRTSSKHRPGTDGYQAIMERLIIYSRPWLDEPEHQIARDEINRNRKQDNWVARKEVPHSESYIQFERYIDTKVENTMDKVSTTPERVYAASVVSGIPLMSIPGLDRYRNESYFYHIKRGESIHIDLNFEKFQDLLIKNPEEVDLYLRALKAFLQAILLGIINSDQESIESKWGATNYYFNRKSGLYTTQEKLGPFSVAIQTLSRDNESKKLLEEIEKQIDKTIMHMNTENEIYWLALLNYHAHDDRSFFAKFPMEHAVRQQLLTLAEEFRNMHSDMEEYSRTALDNLSAWAKEKPKSSGLFTMQNI